MENNTYCYFGKTLFKTDAEGNDFWINPKFHDEWQEVEFEHGPHPTSDYPVLEESEALEFAMGLGMSEEAFRN